MARDDLGKFDVTGPTDAVGIVLAVDKFLLVLGAVKALGTGLGVFLADRHDAPCCLAERSVPQTDALGIARSRRSCS